MGIEFETLNFPQTKRAKEVSTREVLIYVMIFKCFKNKIFRAEDNIMHVKVLVINLHKAWFDSPVVLSLVDLSKDHSEI